MAGVSDLEATISKIEGAVNQFVTAVITLITENQNETNRLLQKIAAGPELQAQVDRLNALVQPINDTITKVNSQIAQDKLEGN